MKNLFVICSLLFISILGQAAALDSCLTTASKIDHRLNRFDATLECFQKSKNAVSSDSCFLAVQNLKPGQTSIELNERLRSHCFYEASQFKTVELCLAKAEIFQLAINHDEAVFECYNQFQENLNQKQCLKLSELLKYPAKKDYLDAHCQTL